MRKLKIVLTLVITLLVLLMPLFDCSATFFDSSFPVYTGLVSGYYYEITCNLGNNCSLFFRESDLGSICLTSSNSFFNVSNSVVYGTLFVNNVIHPVRIPIRGTIEYANYNANGTTGAYNPLTQITIIDTNIDMNNINPDSTLANNNLYFNKFEVAILSVSISVLFFTILNWWLLHERRIKSH